MKTIEKDNHIKVCSVTYKCEHCDFEDSNSWSVIRHEVTHLDIIERTHGSFVFYRALDEETLKKYINGRHYDSAVIIEWDGPGWYSICSSSEDPYQEVTFSLEKSKIYLEKMSANARQTLKEIDEINENYDLNIW
jgi:hypothetical protein